MTKEQTAAKEQITVWLRRDNHDRAWLAEQIGSTLGTMNQWFSKGFPDWALKSIDRLMNPPGSEDGGLEVTFTTREFERIEQARQISGHATRPAFYQDAIREFTDSILAREKLATTKPAEFLEPQVRVMKITDPGDSDLLWGEQLLDNQFQKHVSACVSEGKNPPVAEDLGTFHHWPKGPEFDKESFEMVSKALKTAAKKSAAPDAKESPAVQRVRRSVATARQRL